MKKAAPANLMPATKFRAKWRDQVFLDRNLTPATFKLAYGVADFCTMSDTVAKYRKTGKMIIWPSKATLAECTGLNLDTIRVGIDSLVEHGHLKRLEHGNQFTGSSTYRLLLKEATP